MSGLLFSSRVAGDQAEHLALVQPQDRVRSLDKSARRSCDNSLKCDAVGHYVQTSTDVVPCQTRSHHLPNAGESEVSLQTRDLFDLGLTHRSASPTPLKLRHYGALQMFYYYYHLLLTVGVTDKDIDVHFPCEYRSRECCKFGG